MSRLLSKDLVIRFLTGLIAGLFLAAPAWAASQQSTVVEQVEQATQQVVAQQAENQQAEAQGSGGAVAEDEQSEGGGQIGDIPAAAEGEATAQIAGRKRMTATRTPSPMVIDGILNEPEWALAERVSDFMQRDPDNGQPGSERTVARVMFDEENIYLSFVMYDGQPERITARDLRRDSRMETDDSIAVILDTFDDRRNGFIFQVNPLGTKYDALLRNESQINSDWDEKWEAAAQITDEGWQVEIAIPWQALRFQTGSHTWGIDFRRELRRRNEEMAWSNYRRGFRFTQISQGGSLVGLEDLALTQRFRFQPYASGGGSRVNASDEPYSDATGGIGVEDFKVQITPNLTADFTANTDFAQVEDDTERVNLSRFSLFYPEKRDFFLESANNFAFGPSSRGHGGPSLSLMHSRRVGLVEGESVPIIYGAKMTGKIGSTNLGLMNVQTNDSEFAPAENYTAIRMRQDVFERSSVGVLLTNVQGGGDHNRVYGVDGTFRFFDYLSVAGYYAGSDDSRIDGNPYVGAFSAGWNSDLWELSGGYQVIDDDFDSKLGYVRQTGIKSQNYRASWKPRPEGWEAMRQIRFSTSMNYLTDMSGEKLTSETEASVDFNLQSGDSINFNYGRQFDRLDYEFEPSEGVTIPVGEYEWDEWRIFGRTYSARKVSGRFWVSGGGYYNGTRLSASPSVTVRFNENFTLSPSYSYNTVDLPTGSFDTHTVGLRTVYNFNDQWLTNALVQYNSVSGRMSIFARLQYVLRGGFDNIFLVYKQSAHYYGEYDGMTDHQVLAKVTYSFDF
jgi:hypothetical protein